MNRPAAPTLSTVLLAAMAVGALLLAPDGAAATGPGERVGTVAPASPRIGPGELRRLLHQVVAAGAPGVAARVADEHGVTEAASGVADQLTGRPMRPGLHYRVGSVTKPFIATVVLQLVAEGRLSLEDTVEHWLPGVLPYGDQVTVRQLLNHRSGVPEYVGVPIVRLYTDPQEQFRAWTPRELVALVANQPPNFPPDTAWSYSNSDYVLAGMIVEAATGDELGQQLRRRIFRPLGLRDTLFPVDRPTIPRPYASGYSVPLGQEQGPLLNFTVFDPSLAWAAGALVADLGELEHFFRALLRGRLLPAPLLAMMTTPVPTGQGFGYGLGLIVIDTPTGRIIGHDGAIPGFRDIVLSTEDGRWQVGMMMNEYFATSAASDAFDQVFMALDTRLFGGTASDVASTSAALHPTVRNGMP
jgi:D-alanyl-D-alanine carboxypeptidase